MSSNMKPSLQCLKAAATAMFVLRSINLSFHYLDTESLNILYKTYVWPHLEHCIQVWSPYLVKDIQQLEKVQSQRQATKLVPSVKHLPYEEWLQRLNLHSLKQRHLRRDLIECYKLLTGKEHTYKMDNISS